MKIALITIHDVNNYGAALQTYATLKNLQSYGQVTTLNYKNPLFKSHSRLVRLNASIHGLMMLMHDLLRLPSRYNALKKFSDFQKNYLSLSPPLSHAQLIETNHQFDAFICGSDQIWNPRVTNNSISFNKAYFLNFVPNTKVKVSYASSIGSYTFTDENIADLKTLLADFTAISTRENDGVKKLKSALPDRKISHVLDPTLLLSANEWCTHLNLGNTTEHPERYILVYSVPRIKAISAITQLMAKLLNLKVLVIDQMLRPITKCDAHIKDAGPREFVELFSKAEYVITDSFHGTCFSIIFGKPFISICNPTNSNRIVSLLESLDLADRAIYAPEQIKNIKNYNPDEAWKKLEKLKNESKKFLAALKES